MFTVVFLVDRWVPGGIKKHVLDITRSLQEQGINCIIAGWLPCTELESNDLTFIHLPLFDRNGNKSVTGLIRSSVKLRQELKKNSVDILHIHNRYLTLLAAFATIDLDTQRIYTVHSIFKDLRFLFFYPANVICLNEAGKKAFLNNWFLPNDLSIHIIPNGIDTSTEHHNHLSDSKQFTFSVISRLESIKGIDQALKALALIGERDIQLLIAGTGPDEDKFRELATELGVNDKVQFLGHVENTGPIFSNSLAVIVPSTSKEGFGYVILEAFAHKLPVIASDLESFDDTVIEGHTGLRFTSGEPENLSRALEYAFNNQDKMKEMGNNGNAMLFKNYSLDRMVKSTKEVYRIVMDSKSAL